MEEHHGAFPYLTEVMVFLAAAGLVVPVLQRLKVNAVLGYLLIGLLIGPFALGALSESVPLVRFVTITDIEGVRTLAEMGIVFLLFTIGLELSMQRLWRMRTLVFGLGGAQVLISGAVIAAIAFGFGNSLEAAIVLGLAFALSSTAIVMKLLSDRQQTATPVGRSAFSVLLLQDLAVVPLLVMVTLFAAESARPVGLVVGEALGRAALAIVLIMALGRLLIAPLFRFVGGLRSPELFMAVTLLTIIGTALITWSAGLSMALGAFLAGLLLAETEYRHQIQSDIEPFKGLLLALFFMSVGMGIDLSFLGDRTFWIIASVIGLIVIKAMILFPLGLAFGLSRGVALEISLLLGQGGEFALVIVGLAMVSGLVPEATGQFMLIVTGLTMILTPLVASAGSWVGAAVAARDSERQSTTDFGGGVELEEHVVIAGYGRVGTMLAEVLAEQGIETLGLDLDATAVAKARREGERVYYGDASRGEILKRAGSGSAQALVVTMDNMRSTEEVIRHARAQWPDLPIFARARDVPYARRLVDLGATGSVPENLEPSLQLAEDLLCELGVPPETAWRRVEGRRDRLVPPRP